MNVSCQSVRQSSKDTVCRAVVDMRIGPVKIAQRFLQPVMLGLEHKPLMLRVGAKRPTDCQTKLKGHIESGRCRRVTIKLDSRQIVKRIPAPSNQLDDSLEPSSGGGNLDGRARSQAERAEAGDECKIKG